MQTNPNCGEFAPPEQSIRKQTNRKKKRIKEEKKKKQLMNQKIGRLFLWWENCTKSIQINNKNIHIITLIMWMVVLFRLRILALYISIERMSLNEKTNISFKLNQQRS